jgi:hypothetical protein
VGQKPELAEVDAQDWDLAHRPRGADDRAVTANDYLDVGEGRILGVRVALGEPGAHFFAQGDRLGLPWIRDHAQASRQSSRAPPVA